MKFTSRVLGWLSPLVVLVGLVWAALHYQMVLDYYYAHTFQPSTAMHDVANDIKLTDKAKFYFTAAQPELNSAEEFNHHCEKKDTEGAVLGCYIGPQHLYVYDVQDTRLEGVRQVTTAHEMLHVAYDRLNKKEKSHVNALLEEALPSVLAQKDDLADRLKIYEKTEPGERGNELHSILGTEAAQLPSELETYYAQYFKDRSIVVGFAEKYTKTFSDIKKNQEQLVGELKSLSVEINTLTTSYNASIMELNSEIQKFNEKASIQGGFASREEFDQERTRLTAQRDELESSRQSINNKTDYYNTKRSELQSLNVKVEELNSQLDSTKVPQI